MQRLARPQTHERFADVSEKTVSGDRAFIVANDDAPLLLDSQAGWNVRSAESRTIREQASRNENREEHQNSIRCLHEVENLPVRCAIVCRSSLHNADATIEHSK